MSPTSAATTWSCGQALGRLPARQRATIVLRYHLDLPEAEVARQLGVPVGTVKSLVHRGLARLRDRLGAQYAGERLTSNTEAER
jgi:DNA-directed RNA polymerase specialized sigma24 family protein